MKYRIVLLHYNEGSGYTHTETIDNINDINFDFEEYLKEYFIGKIFIKNNEWYDALIIDNETDEIINEFFNINIDFLK